VTDIEEEKKRQHYTDMGNRTEYEMVFTERKKSKQAGCVSIGGGKEKGHTRRVQAQRH